MNKLINENHQGGLPKRQSTTTVLDVFDRIIKAKKDKRHSAIISMDQSGAFDLICHTIIKAKFKQIGMDDETIEILELYLQERKQYVVISTILYYSSLEGR